ncbi:MAG: hypothetical protein K2G42_05640 [Clostridia bacterium]|nr:hypothetical protein [Clostridia bacterium]
MKKKIFIGLSIFCIMCAVITAFVGCDNSGLGSESGQDKFGRTYGEIYDIDDYTSGIYAIEYEIGDTSAMGKSMIGSNCYEKIKLAISDGEYTLTFYCKNTAFSDVKLNGELGQRVEESGMYGYQFKIDRENLDTSLAMTGKVSLMNKDVAFSIKVDLSKSALIGNNAINKDDGASGNN